MSPEELESVVGYIEGQMAADGQSMRAFALSAGLKPDAVRDIVRGKSKSPKRETLEKLAQRMGVTVDELLGRDDKKTASVRIVTSRYANRTGQIFEVLVRNTVEK